MYFDSWQALLMMSGHGVYVWPAYGISVLVLIVLIVAPLRRQQRFITQQRQLWRRQQQSGSRG